MAAACASARAFCAASLCGVIRHDRPLGQLHADAVHAGLDDDVVALDVDDLTDDAADGRDLVAFLQRIAKVLFFLLFLLLGADDHEVEHRDHNDKDKDHAVVHRIFLQFFTLFLLYRHIAAIARKIL